MAAPELRETPVASAPPEIELYDLGSWRTRFGVIAGITSGRSDFTLVGAVPTGRPAGCWKAFREQHQTAFRSVVAGYQCHGIQVVDHRQCAAGLTLSPGTDGHVTRLGGVLLAVTVADCVPLYLSASDGSGVGLLHVGWKGIASGLVERGVETFCRATGTLAWSIASHCGIAICGTCYEVGPEVVWEVRGQHVPGPSTLDLRSEIVARLTAMGVSDLTVSPWCTMHDSGRFHSHRGSGGRAGRMLAYVGRPLA